jgi:hypothetical protein
MPNENQIPLERQLAARRQAAMRKYEFARGLQKHADSMRREAEREMQEIEIAERVYRELPATESQAMALEQSVSMDKLLQEAQMAAARDVARRERAERNAVPHELSVRIEPSNQSLREMVGDVCVQLLQDGSWKSTEDLHQALDAAGVPLGRVQNPVQRVSQILSQDDRFKTQRGRGWALATAEDRQDEWSEQLERRSRELVRKDSSTS